MKEDPSWRESHPLAPDYPETTFGPTPGVDHRLAIRISERIMREVTVERNLLISDHIPSSLPWEFRLVTRFMGRFRDSRSIRQGQRGLSRSES